MTPSGIVAVRAVYLALVLKGITLVTVVVLVAALALAVVLSALIKRQSARRGPYAGAAGADDSDEIGTAGALSANAIGSRGNAGKAAKSSEPFNVQNRLQRLTSPDDLIMEEPAYDRHASLRAREGAERRAAVTATLRPSATSMVHESDNGASSREQDDADATRFFGEELPANEHDDATRLFRDEDENERVRRQDPDATAFFDDGHETGAVVAAGAVEDGATRFFDDHGQGQAPAGSVKSRQRGDGGGISGSAGVSPVPALNPGRARRPRSQVDNSQALQAPAGTETGDGYTGMLHALPAHYGSARHDQAAQPEGDLGGTGFLAALPPASGAASAVDVRLDHVRERLALVDLPDVLAMSVIDSAGRVLAGESDPDLTGELRSLMAESGQGSAADLEQPVLLADDSTGIIVLVPTGANAVLGALARDDGGARAQAARAALRELAEEIGNVMYRAS